MRTLLHVSSVTLTALVHMATVGVTFGALAAIYSQSVKTGLLVATAALSAGVMGFAYSVWRIHRPPKAALAAST